MLLLCWLAALCCIPALMYIEESTIQSGNSEFRLGSIHATPFLFALVIPWFAKTSIKRRAIYFCLSIAAIMITLLVTAVMMLMSFGLTGVQ